MQQTAPKLSIVIVNWNSEEVLRDCLNSLAPDAAWCQIIVVDNASKDGSVNMIKNHFPFVRLLETSRNLGYAAGNNAGFALCEGEFVLTLNPDTVVPEGGLQTVLRIIEDHPAHGLVAPKLIGLDGKTQFSVREFPTLSNIIGDFMGASQWKPDSKMGNYRLKNFDYETQGPAPQPMGTFLLFRRSALEEVSSWPKVFDEDFPIFFNEVDLLKRMSLAGWPALYTNAVAIRHVGGFSTRQVRKEMIWESHRSLARYLLKHRLVRWGYGVKCALWITAFLRTGRYCEPFRP